MKAVKDNKVYTITDENKSQYKNAGYDITDDKGKVLEEAVGKTVAYEKYAEILAENKKLKAENAKLKKGE